MATITGNEPVIFGFEVLYINEETHCTFIAHMSIFKLDEEISKCRNVFLSKLSNNKQMQALFKLRKNFFS